MPDAPLFRWLFQRLRSKLASIAPVLAGSALLFAALWALAQLLMPYLPEGWQRTFALLNRGDWKEARDELRHLLQASGHTPELAFFALQFLQVLLAPVPGQVIGLLGGYLFGFWYGLLLTMVGLALGSCVVIGLGRLLGKYLVRRIVSPDLAARFDARIAEGGLWNFFLIFLLPVFPDDAACFLAGLTRLSVTQLVLVCVLGRLPGMAVLTFVGAGAGEGFAAAYTVLAVVLALSFLLWLFSEEVEGLLLRRGTGRGWWWYRSPGHLP